MRIHNSVTSFPPLLVSTPFQPKLATRNSIPDDCRSHYDEMTGTGVSLYPPPVPSTLRALDLQQQFLPSTFYHNFPFNFFESPATFSLATITCSHSIAQTSRRTNEQPITVNCIFQSIAFSRRLPCTSIFIYIFQAIFLFLYYFLHSNNYLLHYLNIMVNTKVKYGLKNL
jgi:hypothetical protein